MYSCIYIYVFHNTLGGKLVGELIDKQLDFDVMSTRDLHFVNLFFPMNLYFAFLLIL